MEQKRPREAAGKPVWTEIAAVMNQALKLLPPPPCTTSLGPRVCPTGAHAGACYWEAGRNALGVEVGGGRTAHSIFPQGRGKGLLLRAGKEKGFSVKVPDSATSQSLLQVTDV